MRLHDHFTSAALRVLQARAARVAAPLQPPAAESRLAALLVTVCGERYALPIAAISGVVESPAIVPVPCAPPVIAGIANVRGHIVSVLCVAAILGLRASSAPAQPALVVAQAGDVSVGLRVDAIGEIAEFDRRTLNPAAGSAAGECLEGIFAEGVGLLSVQAILGDGRLLVSDRGGL